jgi:hypothetical protein
MFNVNGMNAVLIQNNRNESEYYDDQDKQRKTIKVCPFNTDQAIRFGINTIPEATGYFIVKNRTPVVEGDQIMFNGRMYSVIRVEDNWIWNKLANLILFVK